MKLNRLLTDYPLILTEAAVVEAVAHSRPELLHPELFNAVMIENAAGRQALTRLYASFLEVAKASDLPFVITTPTWRANQDRISRAGVSEEINEKAVAFLRQVIPDAAGETPVCLAGLLGGKNDCYRPDLGLDEASARKFHAWQARRLAREGVDFLMAATLPAMAEARGLARAMEETGLPYVISFVINRKGEVLDGTPLDRAMAEIDQAMERPPEGYMVNCAHPSFLLAHDLPATRLSRLIGFQANGSSLDHDQLDRAPEPHADDIREWADQMIRLNLEYGVRILGGCCGTRTDHLACLARGIQGKNP